MDGMEFAACLIIIMLLCRIYVVLQELCDRRNKK
jgi:hypothetical protein